jgi:predicted transcriptional regulator
MAGAGMRKRETNEIMKLAILDLAIQRGLADVTAGRVVDADDLFAKLEAKFRKCQQE